jgi:2-dehydro-3-deoxygluconokinase
VSGAESNLAIALTRLGVAARWVSRLGDDAIGRLVMQTLGREGVDTSRVIMDPDHPTAVTFKLRNRGATSLIYYRRGSAASHLSVADVPTSCFENVRAIHLTGITMALGPGPRDLVISVARRAAERGIPVTFDINYRPALWEAAEAAAGCRTVFGHATWVLFGEEEGRSLFGGSDTGSVISSIREAGATSLVCRIADRGAAVVTGDSVDHVPAVPIERIVDDIGAGDAFDAGFVFGLVNGWSPVRGARLGTYLASRALSGPGEWEAAPTRAEVDAWLDMSSSLEQP